MNWWAFWIGFTLFWVLFIIIKMAIRTTEKMARSEMDYKMDIRDKIDDHFGGTSWRPPSITDLTPPADSPAIVDAITYKSAYAETTASGIRFTNPAICGGCGTKTKSTDKYCMECGMSVSTDETPFKKGNRIPKQKDEPRMTSI